MNRLAQESSLYLRQHQSNPVDWFPWGEEAFARARAEDRPILLSVGYSSCHWCHVMAHESFEDGATAALQNRLFVSIKVDREERPDVDRVYMEALQAMTGSGGWPMTVFLLPDGRPFFAGTYFPPQDRHGLPSFRRVLEAVEQAYRERRGETERVAAELTARLRTSGPDSQPPGQAADHRLLEGAAQSVVATLDPVNGGFGGAPKFPQAPLLEFLLTRAALAGDQAAGEAVELTLAKMAEGGVRDQLGGGFHRYSVDQNWAVPHFEKMLYDQAQLISLYLHLHQLRGIPEALAVARSTADFLISGLGLPEGGFAASLDADTEHGEGLTYLWTRSDLEAQLGREDLPRLFRLDRAARLEGGYVLQAAQPWGRLAEARSPQDPQRLEQLLQRLLLVRESRDQPVRDEKVVAGWNALAVAALAELGVATGQPSYLDAALRAGELLRTRCSDSEGHLLHVFDGGRARFPATLDDLAAAGLAGLALHEATGAPRWFDWALELAKAAEARHRDANGPLWFDSAAGHDPLLTVRPMGFEDGALRSGVSLMTELCLRLGALTGDQRWEERAVAALDALAPALRQAPGAFGGMLLAGQLRAFGLTELAILAPTGSTLEVPLLAFARRRFRPQMAVGVGWVRAGIEAPDSGPPLVRGRSLLGGLPTAYVCRNFSCRQPTVDLAQMEAELDAARPQSV
ncbi:MAG TPA: thioredoxin domain-containing protein [Candidatus Nanopelagicaceae bacterium]|nr:thioredoxin domain-containing protein [Candidatus Nanopelagicaceae bacterium]